MKFLKYSLKRNRLLNIIFLLSLFIFVSYELTMDMKEWFIGGDFIYRVLSQLALGFLGGYVFYMFQSQYAEFKLQKQINQLIIPKLESLNKSIDGHVKYLCQFYISKSSTDNLTDEELKQLYAKLDVDQDTMQFDENGNSYTIKGLLVKHKAKVQSIISKIYLSMGNSLDNDITSLLDKIELSEYLGDIEILENTKLGNQNIKQSNNIEKGVISTGAYIIISLNYKSFKEYYMLNKELEKYIENLKIEL
jgi:hypothetical protein